MPSCTEFSEPVDSPCADGRYFYGLVSRLQASAAFWWIVVVVFVRSLPLKKHYCSEIRFVFGRLARRSLVRLKAGSRIVLRDLCAVPRQIFSLTLFEWQILGRGSQRSVFSFSLRVESFSSCRKISSAPETSWGVSF